MREILFRGKTEAMSGEKYWVYGSLVTVQRTGAAEIHQEPTPDYRENCYLTQVRAVEPDTIGQYTGLQDVNGVKIFEGDIVRDMRTCMTHLSHAERGLETVAQAEIWKDIGKMATVEFCTEGVGSCGCCYEEFNGSGFKAEEVNMQECIVIGNIHDNPELLKR